MFGLSFLSPAFLLGAIAAAVPIALHLLGRRPYILMPFPAVRLLQRTPAQETRRRRLRDLLLLALRVTALVLIAVAFARPYLLPNVAARAPRAVLVAVDRSLSMSAPGQFDRARETARSIVEGAGGDTPVGLMAFDDESVVLVAPTTDRAAVLDAINRLEPGYGATAFGTALARAGEVLRGTTDGRVAIVTDLQRTGWARQDAAVPAGLDVVVHEVRGPATNLAVSDVRLRDGRVTALVRNSGEVRRSGRARLAIDGQQRGSVPFVLAGGAAETITFSGPAPERGEARAEIDDADGYKGDNVAYALLDPPDPPAFLAIAGDSSVRPAAFYLQRALEVDGGRLFRLETLTPGQFSAPGISGRLHGRGGVFVLDTRLAAPAVNALEQYVNSGGAVIVAPEDQSDPQVVSGLLGRQAAFRPGPLQQASTGLLMADARHPVFRQLSGDAFAQVRFVRAASVDAPGGDVLARFGDGSPALVEVRHGAGRVLLFGSDLANRWNDLPLQPSFLPLVHELARYMSGGRAASRELLVSQVTDRAARRPGIAAVRPPEQGSNQPRRGTQSLRVVVNVDPRESEVARITPAEFSRSIARGDRASAGLPADGRQAEQQQGLWRVALALAVVALVVEGRLASGARR